MPYGRTSGLLPPGLRPGQACEVDTELKKFATDALHAPEAVLPGHLLDQSDGFGGHPGAPIEVRTRGGRDQVEGRYRVIYSLDPQTRNRALPSWVHLRSFLEISFYTACPDCAIVEWAVSIVLRRCRMGRRAQGARGDRAGIPAAKRRTGHTALRPTPDLSRWAMPFGLAAFNLVRGWRLGLCGEERSGRSACPPPRADCRVRRFRPGRSAGGNPIDAADHGQLGRAQGRLKGYNPCTRHSRPVQLPMLSGLTTR